MKGLELYEFAKELQPIKRSISGEGVRKTLELIKQHLPDLEIKSVHSGTEVFDWVVPKEWHPTEAYIITPSGDKICDFKVNNLHLLSYNTSFDGNIKLEDLKEHLYTLPEQPEAISYITSSYRERWGFCLSQNQFDQLEDADYYVKIEAKHFDVVLNFSDLIIPGESQKKDHGFVA